MDDGRLPPIRQLALGLGRRIVPTGHDKTPPLPRLGGRVQARLLVRLGGWHALWTIGLRWHVW
jgi:hypothetical protein